MKFIAEVPSNLALIKYWGRKDEQSRNPANDSLSLTLSNFVTTTSATVNSGAKLFSLRFNGKLLTEQDAVAKRAAAHLRQLGASLGFGKTLTIESSNNFPDSCGIASSASGFGALTLAAVAAWSESKTLSELATKGYPLERLANLARLGSGSACRSFFEEFCHWHTCDTSGSQWVTQVTAPKPWEITDLVVLVSSAPKAISSSEAHRYAWTSPLFPLRLEKIPSRIEALKAAINAHDFSALGEIAEEEALEMHSVMMSGTPSVKYFGKDTTDVLLFARTERQAGNFPAYFTLDAGANVHILCEKSNVAHVRQTLANRFPRYELLTSETGAGPRLTTETLEDECN